MEIAEALAVGRSIPLPIVDLCQDLGVEIHRSQTGRARALLVDAKNNPKVLLPLRDKGPAEFTLWERFLIAHELGHLVLHHQGVAKPKNPSEYWKTERLCDAFARWLLVPESRFGELGRQEARTAAHSLNLTRYLESNAGINWAGAAMRVTDWHCDVTFLQLRRELGNTLKVCFCSTPKEIGRKIPISDPLATALVNRGGKRTLEALPAELLGCFPSLSEVSSCVMMGSLTDFRLAVASNPNTRTPSLESDPRLMRESLVSRV